MAKVRVKICVAPKTNCEELYIVGSTSSLGYWDVKKATKLKYCEECQKFVVTKVLPVDETVEFKFITARNWNNVEKGIWKEEISNRTLIPVKCLKLDLTIETFNN